MKPEENIQKIKIEDIISQFDGLYDKQEIENKIFNIYNRIDSEEKEQFISYIQNANASGGGISKYHNSNGIFKPDGIEKNREVFNKILNGIITYYEYYISDITLYSNAIEEEIKKDNKKDIFEFYIIAIENSINNLKKIHINTSKYEKKLLIYKEKINEKFKPK